MVDVKRTRAYFLSPTSICIMKYAQKGGVKYVIKKLTISLKDFFWGFKLLGKFLIFSEQIQITKQ